MMFVKQNKMLKQLFLAGVMLVTAQQSTWAQVQSNAMMTQKNMMIANELVGLLSTMNSMQAEFTQSTKVSKKPVGKSVKLGQGMRNNLTSQVFTGQMQVKRPYLFRWETKSPMNQLIIADKNQVWIYDEDLMQATRQSVDTQLSNTPALLLSGQSKEILKTYQISKKQSGEFILNPRKKDNSAFEELRLTFSGEQPTKMVLLDSLGQETNIVFKNVVMNAPLSDQLFKFTPPKGVDIIDQ